MDCYLKINISRIDKIDRIKGMTNFTLLKFPRKYN